MCKLKLLLGLKVLCVDDEPISLQILTTVLSHHGAAVTAVESVELAIVRFSENTYDVVISDLSLPPGLDGYDLAHAMRKMEADDQSRIPTPSLCLSGSAFTASPKKRFADFQVYMQKPIDKKRLLDIVERLAEADGASVKFGSLKAFEHQTSILRSASSGGDESRVDSVELVRSRI